MTQIFNILILLSIAIIFSGCADKSYPANMTSKERAQYYKDFNESKTEAEWDEIRSKNKSEKNIEVDIENTDDIANSISFSVKNNSALPKKLRIVDNILDFNPFEKRYVGFPPNTKVYVINGQKEEFLFEVSVSDEGKEFKIVN